MVSTEAVPHIIWREPLGRGGWEYFSPYCLLFALLTVLMDFRPTIYPQPRSHIGPYAFQSNQVILVLKILILRIKAKAKCFCDVPTPALLIHPQLPLWTHLLLLSSFSLLQCHLRPPKFLCILSAHSHFSVSFQKRKVVFPFSGVIFWMFLKFTYSRLYFSP